MTKPSKSGDNACVLVERNDSVLSLALNRPEANNAINNETRDALLAAFEAAAKDAGVRAIVLTSVGEDAFCVGRGKVVQAFPRNATRSQRRSNLLEIFAHKVEIKHLFYSRKICYERRPFFVNRMYRQ